MRLPVGVGHGASLALLGLFTVDDRVVEGFSNSLSSMLALLMRTHDFPSSTMLFKTLSARSLRRQKTAIRRLCAIQSDWVHPLFY